MKKYLNEIMLLIVGFIFMCSSGVLGLFIKKSSSLNVSIDEMLCKVKDYVFIFGFVLVIIASIVVVIKITELYLNTKSILLNDIEKVLIFLALTFLLIIPLVGAIFLILIISIKWMTFEAQKEEKQKNNNK